jgi:hypothetical protein
MTLLQPAAPSVLEQPTPATAVVPVPPQRAAADALSVDRAFDAPAAADAALPSAGCATGTRSCG